MKDTIKEKLKGMIGVRKFIALSMTLVFSYLAIVGTVAPQEFLPVFSMVIGYYFGRSTALDHPDYTIDGETLMSEKDNGPSVG